MATASAPAKNPKAVTIRGRASFPRWTYAEALAANDKSKFKKTDVSQVAPEFNLLVEQAQLDKIVNHIRTEFLPYAAAQFAKGPKERDALDPKTIKKIEDLLDSGDWADQPPFLPIKVVGEKTAELVPEAVASIKVTGPKGADIDLKATIQHEGQLLVPDPDILTYPVTRPIEQTVFQPYAGAYFAATLNLFAFIQSNSIYGISAGANVAFYVGDLEGERLGGGMDVNEDEIFLND